MAGIKFHDQVNVSRRKKSNLIFPLTQCWEVRSYRCCNTWCQFVCLLLQRPGVVFPKFEREKKKKKKACPEKSENWNVSCCELLQLASAEQVLTGSSAKELPAAPARSAWSEHHVRRWHRGGGRFELPVSRVTVNIPALLQQNQTS